MLCRRVNIVLECLDYLAAVVFFCFLAPGSPAAVIFHTCSFPYISSLLRMVLIQSSPHESNANTIYLSHRDKMLDDLHHILKLSLSELAHQWL